MAIKVPRELMENIMTETLEEDTLDMLLKLFTTSTTTTPESQINKNIIQ